MDDALDAINLLNLKRRPIYALSGGQKQRVAIAGPLPATAMYYCWTNQRLLLDPDSQIDLGDAGAGSGQRAGFNGSVGDSPISGVRLLPISAFLLRSGKVMDEGDPERLKKALQNLPLHS